MKLELWNVDTLRHELNWLVFSSVTVIIKGWHWAGAGFLKFLSQDLAKFSKFQL